VREKSSDLTSRPRDYYRIEDEDGRRYWVFREGLYQEAAKDLPAWYLHGVFG
jgi:protein ImuB